MSLRRVREGKSKALTNPHEPLVKPSTSKTAKYAELPRWMQDNEYILAGYRWPQYSFRSCVLSAFTYLHTETVNIHSHWGGAVLFAYLLCVHLPSVLAIYDTDAAVDLLFLLAFGLAAITCLFFSGTYHMAGCHSPEVANFCHKLDYSGISILIVGSMYPCMYYSFYCHPNFRHFYLAAITLAGLGAAYVTLSPEYSRPTHRRLRTYVFIGLGLCGVIPTIHSVHLHGLEHMRGELGLDWIVSMAGLYIAGALIYAERIPERLWPGKFDIFGASHQIFHFCVVAAALCHYKGLLESVKYVHGVKSGRCPWEIGNGW